jgi:hypothetical protein
MVARKKERNDTMVDCNVYNTTIGDQVENLAKFKLFHRFE